MALLMIAQRNEMIIILILINDDALFKKSHS